MFEIGEIKQKTKYNPLFISKQAPFTQAWFYGEWQEMMGRKVRRFEIIRPRRTSSAQGRPALGWLGLEKDSEIIGFFQIIRYSLSFSQNLLYIPHGPIFRIRQVGGEGEANDIFLKEFRDKLLEIVKEENAILARFDFYSALTANLGKYFKKVPDYAYNSFYFQPKYEWVLNIDKLESELLGNMHSKNRYNIRLAENKGVAIEIIENNFEKYFEDFYSLMERTARRNNFKLHPEVYYKNVFETCKKNNNAFLALAKYDDKILAINLILLFGETAYFVFGGSSDKYKNLMAPHLSHWQGIIEAKNRGYKFYNFGGVSSSDEDDEYKSWEGISRFKKGFGGRLLEYSDSYDLILKPFWHYLYNLRKWVLNQKYPPEADQPGAEKIKQIK